MPSKTDTGANKTHPARRKHKIVKSLMSLDSIDSNINDLEYFNRYIDKRQPNIFTSKLCDKEWHCDNWTLDYMIEKSGQDMIKVEYRSGLTGKFGRGQEKRMKFAEFAKRMMKRDQSLYMTTQDLLYSTEGRPSLLSPPLSKLKDDFPLVPSLFKNLIVFNLNLWIGCSTKRTTSGLHHDYHDNLYILLKGEKKFTIYHPNQAPNMYTVGKITKIHENGRINYEGQPTNADGSDIHAYSALNASNKLNQAVERLVKLENNNNNNGNSVEEQIEVEDEIDQALEELLDAEMDDYCDSNEECDDYEDEDDDEEQDLLNNNSGNDDINDTKSLDQFLGIKRKNKDDAEAYSKSKKKTKNNEETTTPSNFSKIDTKLSQKQLLKKYPLFVKNAQKNAITFTLKAGQMLYLPAGWFHEVESYNGGDSYHMAFNYWFHPPDNHSFEKPYAQDFWKHDFEERMKENFI